MNAAALLTLAQTRSTRPGTPQQQLGPLLPPLKLFFGIFFWRRVVLIKHYNKHWSDYRILRTQSDPPQSAFGAFWNTNYKQITPVNNKIDETATDINNGEILGHNLQNKLSPISSEFRFHHDWWNLTNTASWQKSWWWVLKDNFRKSIFEIFYGSLTRYKCYEFWNEFLVDRSFRW